MQTDHDVIIVGGGLNGPVMALALSSVGLRSAVIDRIPAETRADKDFDGRAYALSLTSVAMLKALGLWQPLAEHAQPILDIHVSDGRAGEGASPLHVHFDHREIEEGPLGQMVEDRHLRPVLLNAIAANDRISQIAPAEVVSQTLDADHVSVTLASGAMLTARLLIAGDGRRSQTADRAGIGRAGHDYGQTALVCAIEHDLPHHGCAHQFFMPSGPLAILPLTGNRSSIVWTERTERANALIAGSDEAFLNALRPAFGDFLGNIRLVGERFSYPLNITMAERLTDTRLALIGDAAHGIHPIAGQGLNLGLRDVAALAEVLTDAKRRGEDVGSAVALERYARWRRADNAQMGIGTDLVNAVFSNDNPLLRAGRDLVLGFVNAVPSLRRGMMREAAGLTGDIPRLMKGLPL